MMEALFSYLRETRTTPAAFAHMLGVDCGHLDDILSGTAPIDDNLARRIVDVAGGALSLADLAAGPAPAVVDLRARLASERSKIDVDRLAVVIAAILPQLIGGARRAGDDKLPALAAEAAANTYLALSTVTSRSGADRLAQALRPIFSEILEEFSAPQTTRLALDDSARRAASLYFQPGPPTPHG